MQQNELNSAAPWWKFGHVWMIIAGPAIVIVASFITLYLAVTRPDELVTEDYYRKGIEINKTSNDTDIAASMAPALQARNHAQTGVMPRSQVPPKP
jgi:hypothetical protein